MDKKEKIEKVLEELFDGVATVDITPEARDEYLQKEALLKSLCD
jgi:hypothetical protein